MLDCLLEFAKKNYENEYKKTILKGSVKRHLKNTQNTSKKSPQRDPGDSQKLIFGS